jgi:hypothetical protein
MFGLVGTVRSRMTDLPTYTTLDYVPSVGEFVRAGPCSMPLLLTILAVVLVEDTLHEHQRTLMSFL